jgi:hypothetical protein
MINLQYNHPDIRVETKQVSILHNLPLTLNIKSHVSKAIIWSCKLEDYSWATYANDSIFDIEIKDSKDNTLIYREWDVINDGSYLDKALYLYCLGLDNSKGLAIGTHDGEFGEWVGPVLDNLTKATLVEASTTQFNSLSENYKNFSNANLIQDLITTDGSKIEFFEGGKGYTNSVKENVIRNWEVEEINSSLKESTSINDLLQQISPNKKLDWLHLDIEGYDAEILTSINLELLPNFIIFEHNNLSNEEKSNIENYLTYLGYTFYKDDPVSYLVIKK